LPGGSHEAAHRERGRFWTDGKCEQGILDSHREGIVTSTTLLANGMAFESAVAAGKRFHRLGIGVHLNLTEGKPVADARHIPTLVDRGGGFIWLRRASGRELLRASEPVGD